MASFGMAQPPHRPVPVRVVELERAPSPQKTCCHRERQLIELAQEGVLSEEIVGILRSIRLISRGISAPIITTYSCGRCSSMRNNYGGKDLLNSNGASKKLLLNDNGCGEALSLPREGQGFPYTVETPQESVQ